MSLSNMDLVHLVTRAYDEGFLAGYLYSDYAEGQPRDREMLTDQDYIGKRDDWVRAHIPEGTTA